MFLRLVLIVPAIGEIVGEAFSPHQTCPSHAQVVESCVGEIADVEPQPLRLPAVFDDELEQDEAFARIAVASAGFEMYVQLLVGLNEPEVVESSGMGEAHPGSDLFPAGIVG